MIGTLAVNLDQETAAQESNAAVQGRTVLIDRFAVILAVINFS